MAEPAAPTAQKTRAANLGEQISAARSSWQYWLLFFGVLLLPLALVLSHKMVGVLVLIGGIITAASPRIWKNTAYKEQFLSPASGSIALSFFLGLCLWLAITAIWSIAPKAPTLFLIPMAPCLAALAMSRWIASGPVGQAERLCRVFAFAIVTSAILLGFEALTGGWLRLITPPTDLSWNRHKDIAYLGRGVTILVLMVFPAALIMQHRQHHWLGLFILTALALYTGISFTISANALGLAVGVLAFVVALRHPRATLMALTGFILACLIFMPAVAAALPAALLHASLEGSVPASWLQRLYVWQATGAEIITGLPFGHGVDYARILTHTTPTIEIAGAMGPLQVFPIHPHSAFLQLWLEGGLPAVLLAAGGLIYGVRALLDSGLSTRTRAGFAGVMAASLVSFGVEASLWQLWRPAAIGLAMAALVAFDRATQRTAARAD
ncbi:MAG: hypothetical protein AAFO78_05195 [Pseudomonadota bacterium]